jgi:hypothetical protein
MTKANKSKSVKPVNYSRSQKAFNRVASTVLKQTRDLTRNPEWLCWSRVSLSSDEFGKLVTQAARELASGGVDLPATLTNVLLQGIELGWSLYVEGTVAKYGTPFEDKAKECEAA